MGELKRILAGWTMIIASCAALVIATNDWRMVLAFGVGFCVGGLVLRPAPTPRSPQ